MVEQDEFIQQLILVDCHLPLKINDLEDISSDQGHCVFARSDLADRYFLFGESHFVEHWPLADSIFVQFMAVQVKLVTIAIKVDQIALTVLDG